LEGVISWNMNTTCNYRCSYCTQRFVDNRAQWASELPAFVAAFSSLAGDWEIKLSGGEPFRHPDFLQAVADLANGGLRVSVVTNFSSSKAELERYAEATSIKPGLLSASLHLEYTDPVAFLDKLVWFDELYGGTVCATCVATRSNLPKLAALRERYLERGIRLKVQPEKQDREVIDYDTTELAQLLALGGHNDTGSVAPSFQGLECWAGARYLIVDHRGDAYRCYPSRRYRKEFLGNVLDGSLRLRNEARPCPYSYCNCTVPQHRGMMPVERTHDTRR
jgi:MoaA/NifB/PqqE/SkfB family radical SAM enzyme